MAMSLPQDDTASVCSGVSAISALSVLSDDLLNCLICTEPFQNPKVLPCHHTFCGPCLERYLQSYQVSGEDPVKTFPCPICRQSVPFPDLDGQFQDAAVEEIQGLVAKISTHPRKVHCDVCKYKKREISAKNHCTSCSINYCEHCSHDHGHHNLFQNHSIIPVTQIENSSLKCEVHSAESVKYYCGTCMSPLCTVCAMSEHQNHNTMELHAALGTKKDSIEVKIGNMSEKVMRSEEFMMQLVDVASVQEAAMKKTKLEIERHVNGLIAQLHARKQLLLDELERTHKAQKKAIGLEKENCSFQLANMKSLWKFAAKLMEPTQSLQLLAMHGDITKMVDSVNNAAPPGLPKELAVMSMFMPKEQMSVGEIQKCQLSAELMRRISEVGEITNGYDSPRAMSPVVQYQQQPEPMKIKYQTPRLCWKADKLGQKVGEINEAYDVTITPNGTVITAEWLNQRLQVFDSTGFSKDILGQNQIQPWGVTLTRDGNLAVTDEKDRTVKVLTPSGTLLVAWKKLSFGWPRGIAINRTGQYIVTDTQHGKHTVSIHLPDGQCIHAFGSQGSGNEQFHWPRYVTVDHTDRILVSDSSNHCVKVFDPTGRFMFKFGSIGGGDGHMKHPRGICVDPNNNIIIADQDNCRVTLYTPEGKFIRHILQIQRPWGVAISEGGLLAVTQKPALSLYKVFDPLP